MPEADHFGRAEAALAAAWALHVPEGLGRLCLGPLREGMTQAQVAAFDGFYGAVERVDDDAARTSGLVAGFTDLEKFGFSPKDIAAAREAWAAVAAVTRDLVTESRGLKAPVLDYAEGRLARVATDHHCTRLTLAGRPVYAADGMAVLSALEALDAGEVLRAGDTVWYSRLGVTAIGFYGDRDDGAVGLLDDPAGGRIRHLILEPFTLNNDAPRPAPVTFRPGRLRRGPIPLKRS